MAFLVLLSAQSLDDPFAGTFSDGQLELQLQGTASDYSGQIKIAGQQFPAKARRAGNAFQGEFHSGGQSFAFKAQLLGRLLLFETDGTTYRLARTGGGAVTQQAAHALQTAGSYQLALPAGWQVRADGSGDVALTPPGPAAGAQELYLITTLREASDPASPGTAAAIANAFIHSSSQGRARKASETQGSVFIHTWEFEHPQNGQTLRLHAYVTGSPGNVMVVLGTGMPNRIKSRDGDLRQVAASLRSAGGALASVQQGSPGLIGAAPVGAPGPTPSGGPSAAHTGGVRTHPMAPPTPGRLSDGKPQSEQYLQHLRGKLLEHLDSYTSSGGGGGYSYQKRMMLHAGGQFEYSSTGGVSATSSGGGVTGSRTHQGVRRGTWRIVTANGTSFLALVYEGASEEEYAELDYRGNNVYVDGMKVFVTNPQ